jgi:hypothetical protein
MTGWRAYWAAQQADIRWRDAMLIRDRLSELRDLRERARGAWIGPAQKHWAVADIDREIDRLEEELDAIAKLQEEEEER